jgi:hypothetical protein
MVAEHKAHICTNAKLLVLLFCYESAALHAVEIKQQQTGSNIIKLLPFSCFICNAAIFLKAVLN